MRKALATCLLILFSHTTWCQNTGFLDDEIIYGDSLLEKIDEYKVSVTDAQIDTLLNSSSTYVNGLLTEKLDFSYGRKLRSTYEYHAGTKNVRLISTYYSNEQTKQDTLIEYQSFLYDERGIEYFVAWGDSSKAGHRLTNKHFYHSLYNNEGLVTFSYGIWPVEGLGWQNVIQKFEYDEDNNLSKVHRCESDDPKSCTIESETTYNEKGQPILTTYPRDENNLIKYEYDLLGRLKIKTQSFSLYPWDGAQIEVYAYEYDNQNRKIFEQHRMTLPEGEYATFRTYQYREN